MNKEINDYLELLMEERGLSQKLPAEMRDQMKSDLEERLNNFFIAKSLEALTEDKLDEISKMSESSPEEISNFFKNNISNYPQFTANLLVEFRQKYLG